MGTAFTVVVEGLLLVGFVRLLLSNKALQPPKISGRPVRALPRSPEKMPSDPTEKIWLAVVIVSLLMTIVASRNISDPWWMGLRFGSQHVYQWEGDWFVNRFGIHIPIDNE